MANADLTRLMSNLRIHLPGAVDGSIKLELYNALNRFFQGSNSWREDIEIDVVPNVQDYELVPSGPCTLVRLISVVDNNNFPVTATLDVETRDLIFNRPITTAATYTAQVALTIAEPLDREGYPVFPEWLLNLYSNDLISGVLSRMLMQPAKPYTNLPLAEFHGAAFRSAVAKAKTRANRRYTYGAQAWRFPRGWLRPWHNR
jgi:hypothetical protein